MIGAGLILEGNSGVSYKNQTGGNACIESSLEGYFLPLNNDFPEDSFNLSLEFSLNNLFSGTQSFDEDKADKFDNLMSSFAETKFVSIDRDKLSESHESWVFVNIDTESAQTITGFDSGPAILTWPNSD